MGRSNGAGYTGGEMVSSFEFRVGGGEDLTKV